MSILTSILRPLFDALLFPFHSLHPMVGLSVASLVVTVLVLLVLKVTSNQEKIEQVKRKIHAGLFEIRLFNDNPLAIMRAQGDILRHNVTYLWLWMIPLLWLIVPLVLILGQLQFHYGYRGLEPGEQALVTVELKEAPEAKPAVELEVPEGLEVETRPVWIPSLGELTWRIGAREWGDYEIEVTVDGETYAKAVQVSSDVRRRSPVRPDPSFGSQLLYPAEVPLPADAPIRSISVSYPAGNAGFSGWEWELTWMVILFLLTIVFALVLRKPMGVTF